LIFYQTGFLSYVILPDGYAVGDKLKLSTGLPSGESLPGYANFVGNALPLGTISEGSFVFNIET